MEDVEYLDAVEEPRSGMLRHTYSCCAPGS
jgi:hypothetical protein